MLLMSHTYDRFAVVVCDNPERLNFCLHCSSFSGEPCTVNLIKLLMSNLTRNCIISNLYSPAETVVCTYYHIDPVIQYRYYSNRSNNA